MTKLTLAPRPILNPDMDDLARWVWEEARGEGKDVMLAVAWVLHERGLDSGPKPAPPAHDPEFATARAAAVDVLQGWRNNPTSGANIWYPVWMMPPVWERTAEFKIQIGNFRFYYLASKLLASPQ